MKHILCMLVCLSLLCLPCTAQTDLPSSYRSDCGLVHDQTPWGTCWAFAGISTIENRLRMDGICLSLSAEELLWRSCGEYNQSGYGWANKSRNDGGYGLMVCGTLLNGFGATAQELPYQTDCSELYLAEERPAKADGSLSDYRATEIVFVDGENRQEVKQAIYDYGAVATVWCEDVELSETHAYYVSDSLYTNHSVCLVGWDDDFSRENFAEPLPENNGAWLVKNSYGTDFGNYGYMWISYEDGALFSEDVAYALADYAPIGEESLLHHDEYGVTDFVPVTKAANVYPFDGWMTAVTLCTLDGKGANLMVRVAQLEENGQPTGESIVVGKATISHNGYVTIPIECTERIVGNAALIVEFSREVQIGVDQSLLSDSGRPVFNGLCQEGESLLYLDGQWRGCSTQGDGFNFSLRAYLSQENPVKEESTEEAESILIEFKEEKESKETNLFPLILSVICFLIATGLYVFYQQRKESEGQ